VGDVTFSFPVEETSPRMARAQLRTAAEGTTQQVLDRTLVIISEAIASSVHRRSEPPEDERIEIRLSISPKAISGELRDGRLGFDTPLEEFDDRVAPHLFVIDHLADHWGLEFGHGARLWFEVGPE
jgi:hypothetical protein